MASTVYEQWETTNYDGYLNANNPWESEVEINQEEAINQTQKSLIRIFGERLNSRAQIMEIYTWSLEESKMDFDGLSGMLWIKHLPDVLRIVKRYIKLILFANFIQGNPHRMGAYVMKRPK